MAADAAPTGAVSQGSQEHQFSVATNDYRGGEEKPEYHDIVTWDRLAEICGQYLGKGQLVALEGRLQTRRWEDDRNVRHRRTEVVASHVEMLSGRKKKDYASEAAATALATQAAVMGIDPIGPELDEVDDESEVDDEAIAVAA
jgi:single-strand DNA-binding protein